mmetsp:Transcript_9322/g.18373  ORF Transcript_9322/g.18373 Transcript_9322/m.18373 type:complete len:265 (-) Transcript_9322:698-1492(-)
MVAATGLPSSLESESKKDFFFFLRFGALLTSPWPTPAATSSADSWEGGGGTAAAEAGTAETTVKKTSCLSSSSAGAAATEAAATEAATTGAAAGAWSTTFGRSNIARRLRRSSLAECFSAGAVLVWWPTPLKAGTEALTEEVLAKADDVARPPLSVQSRRSFAANPLRRARFAYRHIMESRKPPRRYCSAHAGSAGAERGGSSRGRTLLTPWKTSSPSKARTSPWLRTIGRQVGQAFPQPPLAHVLHKRSSLDHMLLALDFPSG